MPVVMHANKDTLLKLRLVSKDMRRRANKVIEKRKVKVGFNWDKRALLLNKRVFIGDESSKVECSSQPVRGVTNYRITCRRELNYLKEAKCPLECSLILESEIEPVKFARIYEMTVHQANLEYFEGVSFGIVEHLTVLDLKLSQFKHVLDSIDVLEGFKCVSVKFDEKFIFPRVKEAKLEFAAFEENIVFPDATNVEVRRCSKIENLLCSRVKSVSVATDKEMDGSWLRKHQETIKEIDFFTTKQLLKLDNLPVNLRKFNVSLRKNLRNIWHEIQGRCPKLVHFGSNNINVSINYEGESSLKSLDCSLYGNSKEKVSIRLRKAKITDSDVQIFNKHPEIIEKSTDLTVETDSFCFNNLPKTLKCLKLASFAKESLFLTRFRTEYKQI